MDIIEKGWNYFINSYFLRNFTAFLFDISCITLLGYCIYFTVFTPIKEYNWGLLVCCIILALLLKNFSIRLRITNVCPLCHENRGIEITRTRTGNTNNYREYVRGDYWHYSEDVEYLAVTECRFCQYEFSELYWKTEHWQGDLTEEAKARKIIEESRKAQTRAIIDAHEEIRRRNRGY